MLTHPNIEVEELLEDIDLITSELVARQDELVALYELTQSTRRQLEIEPVLETVLRKARGLFKVQHAFALLEDGDQFVIMCAPEQTVNRSVVIGWFDEMRTLEADLLLDSVDGWLDSAESKQNLLLTPVEIDGKIVAGIGLIGRQDGAFTSPDRKMLHAVATQVGAHIENVFLHREALAQARMNSEMDLAREVQMRLLPQEAPTIAGLQVAASAVPALEVGGDFYDFLEAPFGLRIAIGDVSGKGMSAAMLMAMVRTTLRNGINFSAEIDAAQWMHHVNEALYADFTEVSMLATAFVGAYDVATRTFTYANAGHSPVIYCPVGQSSELLEADGTALGVLPMCFCELQSLRLGAGDILVMGTDGLVEARNTAGEMFGYERLQALIEQSRHLNADALATLLLETLDAFGENTPQDDDQTLVVLVGVEA